MSRSPSPPLRTGRQAGATLIEALVALLIMAFGMLALAGLQSNMRRNADLAKQRSEAVRVAQKDMELQRAFGSLEEKEGLRPYDAIADADNSDAGDTAIRNAHFVLERKVVDMDDERLRQLRVKVLWEDRTGTDQDIAFTSFVSRIDPRLSASLSIAPDGEPTRRPRNRSVAIPPAAKDLGDGRSAFKPPNSGGVAWVFSNLTGQITSYCGGLSPELQSADLTLAHVSTYCDNTVSAYLLSGHVRFATGDAPDPRMPDSPALPFDMAIELSSGGHPDPAYQCFDAAPASVAEARPNGVPYYCAIFPNSAAIWSGTVNVKGITLGDGGHEICRYSADYDGNHAIANLEHPLQYSNVKGPLTRQNFLVIKVSSSCPAGSAADASLGHFFNSATVLHQPDGVQTPY